MRIVLAFIICLMCSNANASWFYLVDKDGVVVAKQNGPAKEANLIKDGLTQIETKDDIDLFKADVRGGKIVEKIVTKKEKEAIEEKKAKKQSAIDKLKVLGLTDDEVSALTGKE